MLISFKVFSLLNHPKTDKTISRWTIRWCHFKKKMTSVQGRERGAPIEQRRVSKSQKSLFILSKFFLSKNDPWRMALRGWPSKDSLEGWPYRDCLRRMDLEHARLTWSCFPCLDPLSVGLGGRLELAAQYSEMATCPLLTRSCWVTVPVCFLYFLVD